MLNFIKNWFKQITSRGNSSTSIFEDWEIKQALGIPSKKGDQKNYREISLDYNKYNNDYLRAGIIQRYQEIFLNNLNKSTCGQDIGQEILSAVTWPGLQNILSDETLTKAVNLYFTKFYQEPKDQRDSLKKLSELWGLRHWASLEEKTDEKVVGVINRLTEEYWTGPNDYETNQHLYQLTAQTEKQPIFLRKTLENLRTDKNLCNFERFYNLHSVKPEDKKIVAEIWDETAQDILNQTNLLSLQDIKDFGKKYYSYFREDSPAQQQLINQWFASFNQNFTEKIKENLTFEEKYNCLIKDNYTLGEKLLPYLLILAQEAKSSADYKILTSYYSYHYYNNCDISKKLFDHIFNNWLEVTLDKKDLEELAKRLEKKDRRRKLVVKKYLDLLH